jgi:uncharacterized protein (TIGR02118 family)
MTLKIAATVVRPSGVSATDARDGVLAAVHGGYVDLCDTWEYAKAGEVMAVAWIRVDALDVAALARLPNVQHAWLVEERPQWDGAERPLAGRPVPGHKQVTFLRRAPALDHEEFARHWAAEHAPLARKHHPALWRYRQNVVVDTLLPGTPGDVDGVAELGMRLRQDFRDRMYDSDEGRAIIGNDVRRFLDLRSSWRLMTREYPVA